MKDGFDYAVSSIVSAFTWYFGGMNGLIKILIAISILDYLTGTYAAWVESKFSSSQGFKGIMKKCFIFLFIGVANLLDKDVLGGSELSRTAVCLFYIGNEGISLVENADRCKIKIPQYIRKRFIVMQQEDEKLQTKEEKKESHE